MQNHPADDGVACVPILCENQDMSHAMQNHPADDGVACGIEIIYLERIDTDEIEWFPDCN